MPEFDPKVLAMLQEEEEALGDRGSDLVPKGHYLMSVDEEESSVDEVGGNPTLKVRAKIIQPEELAGRNVGATFWWYGSSTSESPKSIEERTAETRRFSKQKLLGWAYQAMGNPDVDSDVATEVVNVLKAMDSPEDDQVTEMMEAFLGITHEQPFIGRVSHRKDRQDKEVSYAEFVPFVYTGGKKNPTAEVLAQSYERGAAKANIVDESITI